MEIRVMDTNFVDVKLIDEYESMIWTDRYNTSGDFELYMPMDISILDYIKEDYYLWCSQSEHLMIIEDIKIKSDVEEGNKIIVTGRSLEQMLDRRIVWGQKVINGSLQNGIKTLLTESIISPSTKLAARKIDNFKFIASTDSRITSLKISAEYTGDDLYEIISTICVEAGIGFKIVLNQTDNTFEFSLYVGDDRSYNQTDNPYVVFSPKFDNLVTSNYVSNNQEYKNIAYVAGEGEGSSRKRLVVGSNASGLNRRELFVDARDISSDNDGVTLSASQYNALLKQRGLEKLAENIRIRSFDSEVLEGSQYDYGKDFFMGDIVQTEDDYGHVGRSVISEFIISHDTSDGLRQYPTFETIQESEDMYEQDN